MAGILGIASFVAALFVVGAFMECDGRKALVSGSIFGALVLLIVMFTNPRPLTDAECWIDWDARSNSVVCD
jgi:hypothetical protein